MPRPRHAIVCLNQTPYYHCISRCVRRAFLCGQDHYSGRSYEHRRDWLEQKLLNTASLFAIKLCAYAIMHNHYHVVLHVRTDLAEAWSTRDVIERWHQLFCGTALSSRYLSNTSLSKAEHRALNTLVRQWRSRLTSISWFMRVVNEAIARQANAEDECTGRFWEGRFKSQALMDETALLACMTYVDLNPIRATQAETPETSEFTGVRHRIKALAGLKPPHDALEAFTGVVDGARGIPYRLKDYLELVDWTASQVGTVKRGVMDANLPPILDRLGLELADWLGVSTRFERHWGLHIDLHTIQRCFGPRCSSP